ncbi:MAG: hypothetical protein HN392_05385 [Anaerolineae bacterium]|nr:hypothetical protein [Anaerolineae bacterium]MBT7075285.1 hypothetical protein [Anaerolineae bacterium]MBT7783791.1 hypothetical protein [Anaerolineae bacterium]
MHNFPRVDYKFSLILVLFFLVFSACSLVDEIALPNGDSSSSEESLATPTALQGVVFPPSIVETVPLSGSRIALKREIVFYFNQPMNHVSVESALHVEPAVPGDFSWVDDATLKFTPSESLDAGASLNFTFDAGAESALGRGLEESLRYSFDVAGALHSVQVLPKDGSMDLGIDSAVVVSFDQPVVPLGADADSLPSAFSLVPVASGRGEWLNTSTYIFYPDGLKGGVTYTATLNSELVSIAGSSLASIDAWSFTTAYPRLLEISPSTEIPLPLDLEWIFTFNQPMDKASVEENFSLRDVDGVEVSGKFVWEEDARSLTFIVDSPLARDSIYHFLLSENALAQGGTPISSKWKVEVYSSPNFAVISTDPEQRGVVGEYASGHIYFSTSVEGENIEEYISIKPEISNFDANAYENAIHFSGNFDPEINYTLRVSPDLKDIWGQELGEEFYFAFSTPRAEAKITFPYIASPFYFTPANTPSFYLQATNIPSLSMTLGEVPLADFFAIFGKEGYELRQNYQPENGISWREYLDNEDNKSETFAVNLASEEGFLKPGIYSLLLWKTGAEGSEIPNFIIASNINLVFKFGATDALVWATALDTGARLLGQPIVIYDEAGTILAEGLTDERGIWHGKIPTQTNSYQNFYAMLGQPGDENFGFSSSTWGEDFSAWNFDLSEDSRPPHSEVYLYTDRPIYRPGQRVYFRAILREAYDGRYSAPTQISLPLTVSNGFGDNLTSLNPTLSEYGTAHGFYTIPEDASAGYYSFYNRDLEFSAYFQVADYRKPEINLGLEITPEAFQTEQSFSAEISSQYYFDAPANKLPISWTLYEDKSYFYIPNYRVGKLNLNWANFGTNFGYYGSFLAKGEGITNADGILKLDFENLDISEGTRELTLEITATEDSGQMISARESVLVHPEEFYIGLRPDLWFGREETEMGFDVLTVDLKKASRATENLHAAFQQVTWERQDSGDYLPTYTPVSEVDLATGDDGAARLSFTPPKPGTYILEVSGGKASTQIFIWVTGASKALYPNLPNEHIQLTVSRDEYLPGDSAQIFIPNPLDAEVQALITIERGTIHKSEIINIAAGGATYTLPLSEDDAPNIFFSAVLLGAEKFRVGYTEINVSPLAQLLNVNLTSQPMRSEPGGEVHFGIQVTDAAGSPVQGEFSLALVDLAALALADPNSEPIENAFYKKTGLGIKTTLSLAGDSIYGVFLEYGGGMGGGGGEFVTVIRDNFPDTAYWNAEIITDINGQAQISVILPDNLTTWRIDLRGITIDTRVGSAELDIVSTKDVLIRPVTPRFLVVGDHIEMAAILHNNTSQELSGRISLQSIGFLLDSPDSIEQEITVPAGGRVKVSWWGTAQDADVAELLFNSELGNYVDITRPIWGALPILRYTSPQSFVTAGTIDDARTLTETISLPRSFIPNGGKLDVTLNASLAALILESLEAIPAPASTSSNEAILSYLLPNIATYKALSAAGINNPELETRLEASLETGVRQLLNSQNEDYSWGWYATPTTSSSGGIEASLAFGGSEVPQSDAYLSAYILLGLWQAQDAGIYIDETVFINARDYLNRASLPYLAQVNPETWQKDRLAFMQYVMQITGGADAIAIDQLDEWREELSPWAQALLALSLDSRNAGDVRASNLLANLEASALRSASGAHWESNASSWRNPGTPTYTTATVIYALAQKDAKNPLLIDAVRYLSAHRNLYGYWSSTYESAWSLLALTEIMKGTDELNASFAFFTDLNGEMLSNGQANALTPITTSTLLDELQLGLPNALNITRGEGVGRLYYHATLFANRAAETAPAINRGIEISRQYYDADCEKDCTPLDGTNLRDGARIKVELTLNLAEDSYYLMVEDHIPAGTEILNQQLKTSQLGIETNSTRIYDPDNPFADGWGWWLFSSPQIGDENITWATDYIAAGTYVLSYTLIPLQVGEYSVLPARAWQSYFPEVQGTSAGEVFRIDE